MDETYFYDFDDENNDTTEQDQELIILEKIDYQYEKINNLYKILCYNLPTFNLITYITLYNFVFFCEYPNTNNVSFVEYKKFLKKEECNINIFIDILNKYFKDIYKNDCKKFYFYVCGGF